MKECPFCHTKAIERDDPSDDYNNFVLIGCANNPCVVQPTTYYDKRHGEEGRGGALAGWNARPVSAEAASVEGLERECTQLHGLLLTVRDLVRPDSRAGKLIERYCQQGKSGDRPLQIFQPTPAPAAIVPDGVREALDFYADPKNWEWNAEETEIRYVVSCGAEVQRDFGKRARKALALITESKAP